MDNMNQSGTYKSKIIALLLLAFFGSFGAHQFYLGNTTAGVIQLVLTVLGILTSVILVGFLLLVAVGIWVFIDFVRILIVDEDDFGWSLEG